MNVIMIPTHWKARKHNNDKKDQRFQSNKLLQLEKQKKIMEKRGKENCKR